VHCTGTGPGARRYGRWWRAASVFALVALIALALTAAAGAVPTPVGPDLVVSDIDTSLLASPPFFIEESDGSIQNNKIDVTVTNRGDRDIGPTKLLVRLKQGPARHLVAKTIVAVRGIGAKKRRRVTVTIDRFVPPKAISLDPIQILANANYTGRVDELLFGNNLRTSHPIPVIAREWNVSLFSAHTVATAFVPNAGVGTLDIKNQTDPGFFWKYDHFDQANRTFVYAAHGGITETATLSGTCFGTGSGSASHAAWPFPDTDFAIDYAQTHYNGTLFAKPETPFQVPPAPVHNGQSTAAHAAMARHHDVRRQLRPGEHPRGSQDAEG
jgi:hypothetical protein